MAGTHAHKSPSGAERFHACPGALPLEDTLPPERRSGSGRASRLGTAAHFLLEKSLRELTHPREFLDRIIELLGDHEDGSMLRPGARLPTEPDRVWFVVDDDMVEGVALAWEYVMDFCESELIDPATIQLESRTNPLPDRDDTSGTADVTIDVPPDHLKVLDYKNGSITVEVEGNPQLLSYLTGKAEDTGWRHRRYSITVVQPNASHPDGRIRTMDVTADDLRAFQAKHRRAVERIDEAAAELQALEGNPNGIIDASLESSPATWAEVYLAAGDHCTFCDAGDNQICPARKLLGQQVAKASFAEDPPGSASVDDVAEAIEWVRWSAFLSASVKAARAFLYARSMEARAAVPGTKFVRGRSVRTWNPDLAAEDIPAAMVEAGLISDNERALLFTPPAPPTLISGPSAEKLVPSKKRKEFNDKFLVKPPGRISLVLEHEKGEAVALSAADDFEDDWTDDHEAKDE